MGICTSHVYDKKRVISLVAKPLKSGKKRKELEEWVEMNRGKVHHRVTELYEAALQNPLSITVVNLNLIRLDPAACQHIARLFPFCQNVITLKLWKCKLGAKGVGFLSTTMKELQHLQVLVLDENAFGIAGADKLADCLLHFSNLRQLSCCSNELQCEGVRLLAEKMGYLNNLTVLMLDENDMTSYGLNHLLYHLNLSKLERLGLSYDRITDCGVQSLIQCAERMQNFKTLDFRGNIVNVLRTDELMRAFPNLKIQ